MNGLSPPLPLILFCVSGMLHLWPSFFFLPHVCVFAALLLHRPGYQWTANYPWECKYSWKKKRKETQGDKETSQTSLPLIVFNQIHLSPFEIIASFSCFSFISCGACTFNVEVQWSPWVLEDSNWTHVLCWFCTQIVAPVEHPTSLWQGMTDENSNKSGNFKQHWLVQYLFYELDYII